jgi:hypothetical protein
MEQNLEDKKPCLGKLGYMKCGDRKFKFAIVRDMWDENKLSMMHKSTDEPCLCWKRVEAYYEPQLCEPVREAMSLSECMDWVLYDQVT